MISLILMENEIGRIVEHMVKLGRLARRVTEGDVFGCG